MLEPPAAAGSYHRAPKPLASAQSGRRVPSNKHGRRSGSSATGRLVRRGRHWRGRGDDVRNSDARDPRAGWRPRQAHALDPFSLPRPEGVDSDRTSRRSEPAARPRLCHRALLASTATRALTTHRSESGLRSRLYAPSGGQGPDGAFALGIGAHDVDRDPVFAWPDPEGQG
jgi:hypothetical protein